MTNYVYIVSTGEKYEGSTVKGVFSTYEKAHQFAMGIEASFEEWEKPSDEEHHFTDYRGRETWLWWSGCDYLQIVKHELK